MKTGKYIFTLEYEGKKVEFNTILRRQAFIKDNNIIKGTCKTYLNMEYIGGHSFDHTINL